MISVKLQMYGIVCLKILLLLRRLTLKNRRYLCVLFTAAFCLQFIKEYDDDDDKLVYTGI